ncbi:MAG: hypothetical protein WC822_00750 [Candidatus Paceibacterota bacterium]|jgi:Tfp pilus assembly protein PilN
MINLIPNEEKKKITRDFYLRIITMIFVMLGSSVLIASILIFPTYIVSSVEKKAINEKLETQKKDAIPLPDQDTMMVIKNLKDKLSLIENAQKNKFVFSQKVINEIVLQKISGIKITEISYQNDLKAGQKINISGKAQSRDILLAFRRALEDDTAFSKVDLPISNFIKGSNIKFYLTLIPS